MSRSPPSEYQQHKNQLQLADSIHSSSPTHTFSPHQQLSGRKNRETRDIRGVPDSFELDQSSALSMNGLSTPSASASMSVSSSRLFESRDGSARRDPYFSPTKEERLVNVVAGWDESLTVPQSSGNSHRSSPHNHNRHIPHNSRNSQNIHYTQQGQQSANRLSVSGESRGSRAGYSIPSSGSNSGTISRGTPSPASRLDGSFSGYSSHRDSNSNQQRDGTDFGLPRPNNRFNLNGLPSHSQGSNSMYDNDQFSGSASSDGSQASRRLGESRFSTPPSFSNVSMPSNYRQHGHESTQNAGQIQGYGLQSHYTATPDSLSGYSSRRSSAGGSAASRSTQHISSNAAVFSSPFGTSSGILSSPTLPGIPLPAVIFPEQSHPLLNVVNAIIADHLRVYHCHTSLSYFAFESGLVSSSMRAATREDVLRHLGIYTAISSFPTLSNSSSKLHKSSPSEGGLTSTIGTARFADIAKTIASASQEFITTSNSTLNSTPTLSYRGKEEVDDKVGSSVAMPLNSAATSTVPRSSLALILFDALTLIFSSSTTSAAMSALSLDEKLALIEERGMTSSLEQANLSAARGLISINSSRILGSSSTLNSGIGAPLAELSEAAIEARLSQALRTLSSQSEADVQERVARFELHRANEIREEERQALKISLHDLMSQYRDDMSTLRHDIVVLRSTYEERLQRAKKDHARAMEEARSRYSAEAKRERAEGESERTQIASSVESIRRERAELEAESARVSRSRASLASVVQTAVREATTEANEELVVLRHQVESNLRRARLAEEALLARGHEGASLDKALSDLNKEVSTLRAERSTREVSIQQLRDELAALKRKSAAAGNSTSECQCSAAIELRETTHEARLLSAALDESRKQLEIERVRGEKRRKALQEAQDECETAQQSRDETQVRVKQLELENKALSRRLAETQAELQTQPKLLPSASNVVVTHPMATWQAQTPTQPRPPPGKPRVRRTIQSASSKSGPAWLDDAPSSSRVGTNDPYAFEDSGFESDFTSVSRNPGENKGSTISVISNPSLSNSQSLARSASRKSILKSVSFSAFDPEEVSGLLSEHGENDADVSRVTISEKEVKKDKKEKEKREKREKEVSKSLAQPGEKTKSASTTKRIKKKLLSLFSTADSSESSSSLSSVNDTESDVDNIDKFRSSPVSSDRDDEEWDLGYILSLDPETAKKSLEEKRQKHAEGKAAALKKQKNAKKDKMDKKNKKEKKEKVASFFSSSAGLGSITTHAQVNAQTHLPPVPTTPTPPRGPVPDSVRRRSIITNLSRESSGSNVASYPMSSGSFSMSQSLSFSQSLTNQRTSSSRPPLSPSLSKSNSSSLNSNNLPNRPSNGQQATSSPSELQEYLQNNSNMKTMEELCKEDESSDDELSGLTEGDGKGKHNYGDVPKKLKYKDLRKTYRDLSVLHEFRKQYLATDGESQVRGDTQLAARRVEEELEQIKRNYHTHAENQSISAEDYRAPSHIAATAIVASDHENYGQESGYKMKSKTESDSDASDIDESSSDNEVLFKESEEERNSRFHKKKTSDTTSGSNDTDFTSYMNNQKLTTEIQGLHDLEEEESSGDSNDDLDGFQEGDGKGKHNYGDIPKKLKYKDLRKTYRDLSVLQEFRKKYLEDDDEAKKLEAEVRRNVIELKRLHDEDYKEELALTSTTSGFSERDQGVSIMDSASHNRQFLVTSVVSDEKQSDDKLSKCRQVASEHGESKSVSFASTPLTTSVSASSHSLYSDRDSSEIGAPRPHTSDDEDDENDFVDEAFDPYDFNDEKNRIKEEDVRFAYVDDDSAMNDGQITFSDTDSEVEEASSDEDERIEKARLMKEYALPASASVSHNLAPQGAVSASDIYSQLGIERPTQVSRHNAMDKKSLSQSSNDNKITPAPVVDIYTQLGIPRPMNGSKNNDIPSLIISSENSQSLMNDRDISDDDEVDDRFDSSYGNDQFDPSQFANLSNMNGFSNREDEQDEYQLDFET